MKYTCAYLLAVAGGNSSPNAKDIERILGSVGLDVDMENANDVVKKLSEKPIQDTIDAGLAKIANVSLGGGGTAAVAADAAPAAVAEEVKESKKEEEAKEESDEDMGFGLFD